MNQPILTTTTQKLLKRGCFINATYRVSTHTESIVNGVCANMQDQHHAIESITIKLI